MGDYYCSSRSRTAAAHRLPEQSAQKKEQTKLRLEQDREDDIQSINQRREKTAKEKKEAESIAFKMLNKLT